MMSLLEYALDVNKTVEEIKELCNKLGISYEDEESMLSDDDITLLDNEIQTEEDFIEEADEVVEEEPLIETPIPEPPTVDVLGFLKKKGGKQ